MYQFAIHLGKVSGQYVQAGGDNGYQQLLVGLSNTGTVMLKPSGSLQVANAQGPVMKNFSLKLDTFLPRQPSTIRSLLPVKPLDPVITRPR